MKHHPDCNQNSACYNDHGAYSDMCQDFDEGYEHGKAEAVEGAKAYRRGYEVGKEAGDAVGYARAIQEVVEWHRRMEKQSISGTGHVTLYSIAHGQSAETIEKGEYSLKKRDGV